MFLLRSFNTLSTILATEFISSLLPNILVTADAPFHTNLDSYQDGVLGTEPNQTFHSAPLVVAPVYQINTFDVDKIDASTESAYMFMAGRMTGLGWGPSIVSSRDLSLVWADQHYGGMAQATNTYMFRGERVLVVFVDDAVRIISESYEELYAVKPVGEYSHWHPDSHEAMLTYDDTVLLIVCPNWEVNLTAVGGPAEGRYVANCLVQEIDPVTNELKFEWTTLDYFTVTDSVWDYHGEGVWDFAHMNSVQKTPDGNFLISYRHLSAIVLVDGKTKDVIWVMGGKRDQFTDISKKKSRKKNASVEFHWQHHPRVTGINRFTFFDNHRLDNGYCWSGDCSRGLEIEFDPVAKTVWLLDEWHHPQGIVSASRGSVQRTSTGSVLIAWGQNPNFVEYTASGDLAMDFQRGQLLTIDHGIENIVAYRVAKGAWEGKPQWHPNISCITTGTDKSIYVSWNGATQVDHYILLSSDSKDDLDGAAEVVAQSPRNGFETEFSVVGYTVGRYARIAALDVNGKILGATPAVDTSTGELLSLEYNITNVTSSDLTVVTGVPSSAAIAVPAGTHASKPPATVPGHLSSKKKLGLILGSVGGAFVALIAFVAFILWYCRLRAHLQQREPRSQQTAGKGEDADQGLLDADEYGLDSFAIRNSTDSDDSENEAYEDK